MLLLFIALSLPILCMSYLSMVALYQEYRFKYVTRKVRVSLLITFLLGSVLHLIALSILIYMSQAF